MKALWHIEWQLPWILLGIVPLIWFFITNVKNNRLKDSFVNFSHVNPKINFQNWKTKWYPLPGYLKLMALILVLVAIARPRKPLVNQSITGQGIDIVLALDVSASMLTQDFNPNRLEVSKKMAADFVSKRINDRIGLIVFSGEAFTQCPLTVDHDILKNFISIQDIGYLEDGTAIGMGLAAAVNRIKDSDAQSKVIVLLTDGKNNRGYIQPETAMQLAKDLGIRVYTIGVGSDQPALSPVGRSMTGELIMDYVKGEIDEALLQKIASETRGQYFRAKDETQLLSIYNTIDSLEKSKIETAVLRKYQEWYRWPLCLALILWIMAHILKESVFRKFAL